MFGSDKNRFILIFLLAIVHGAIYALMVPAWQHYEAERKGSIEAGKLADFVILSQDPTTVDPETLDALKVLMTIKEGTVVFALD